MRPQCQDTTLRKRKKERKKESPPKASPAALADRRQRQAKAQAEKDEAERTGKYRSEMTPRERKAFDRKVAKLRPKASAEPPPRHTSRKSTHVAMTPEERETGLRGLESMNAARTAAQPRREP
jgi:hypothetical protein